MSDPVQSDQAQFYVMNLNRELVPAKIATDLQGNPIANPNPPVSVVAPGNQILYNYYDANGDPISAILANPNNYLVAPVNWDIADAVTYANNLPDSIISRYAMMKSDFGTGGSQDFQRAYQTMNGSINQNLNDPVPMFKDAASYNLGVVSGVTGDPKAADLAVSAIKAADFVLIPVQPSPYDIWATADLVDLIKQRIDLTDGRLQAAFVVSRAIKGSRIGNEATGALTEYGLPVLESRITQRVSFPGTAASGTTVLDTEPRGEAAREIRALASEIQKLF